MKYEESRASFRSGDESPNRGHYDVLIVTAVKEECDAVLAVDTDALGSKWEQVNSPERLETFARDFEVEGGVLRFLVTRSISMGREAAVMAAAPLIDPYGIRCLASSHPGNRYFKWWPRGNSNETES